MYWVIVLCASLTSCYATIGSFMELEVREPPLGMTISLGEKKPTFEEKYTETLQTFVEDLREVKMPGLIPNLNMLLESFKTCLTTDEETALKPVKILIPILNKIADSSDSLKTWRTICSQFANLSIASWSYILSFRNHKRGYTSGHEDVKLIRSNLTKLMEGSFSDTHFSFRYVFSMWNKTVRYCETGTVTRGALDSVLDKALIKPKILFEDAKKHIAELLWNNKEPATSQKIKELLFKPS